MEYRTDHTFCPPLKQSVRGDASIDCLDIAYCRPKVGIIPTLDRWSRIGPSRQRCLSEQDAAGARRRAATEAAPIARRTLAGPGWRWCGHLLRALTPAPLPLGEERAEAGAEARLPLTRGIAAGADAPAQ